MHKKRACKRENIVIYAYSVIFALVVLFIVVFSINSFDMRSTGKSMYASGQTNLCENGVCFDDSCGVKTSDGNSGGGGSPTIEPSGSSLTMLMNPSESQDRLLISFSDSLNVDANKLSSEMPDVLAYNKNIIEINTNGKYKEPFMITKRGNSEIKISSFDGYIIELEKEPILAKKASLEKEVAVENIKATSTATSGQKKMIIESNMDELDFHKKSIDEEHSIIKSQIISAIQDKRKDKPILVSADKIISNEFKKTFNGFALRGISKEEAEEIKKIKGVKSISPNYEVTADLYDSVPIIKAQRLWEGGYTGDGINIAIIDTGVDYTHHDLGGCLGTGCKVADGYDFVNKDNDPMDDHGHGTHVAATAAGDGGYVPTEPELENTIKFSIVASDKVTLDAEISQGISSRLYILGGNGTHFTYFGRSDSDRIKISNRKDIIIDLDTGKYFIASFYNQTDYRSDVLEISGIDGIDGITIKDYQGNVIAADKKINSTFYIGYLTLTVSDINEAENYVVLSVNQDGYFDSLFDTNGYNIKLDESLLNSPRYTFTTYDKNGHVKEINDFKWYDNEIKSSPSSGGGVGGGGGSGIPSGDGLIGVAPHAKIYAYKVLDYSGSGYFSDVIASIERSVDPNDDSDFSDHADIISMSLGANCGEYSIDCGPDDAVSTAIDNAVNNGVVAVIAAGNDGGSGSAQIGSPGTARKAITVGATDKYDNIAYFSSRGPVRFGDETIIKPDVVAPGVNICAAQYDSAWETNKCFDEKHVSISGTSMATPHVAGAAALLLQSHPTWSPDDVKSALMLNAHDLGLDPNTQGRGRIDVAAANKSSISILPSQIGFGTIVDQLPKPQIITIHNNKNYIINLSLRTDCSAAALSSGSLTIEPGNSSAVILSITSIPERDGTIVGSVYINVDGSQENYKLPFIFDVLSKIIVSIDSGKEASYSDLAIINKDMTYFESFFDVVNNHTFFVSSGEYSLYAGGDTRDIGSVEYLLMKKVDVLPHESSSVTLSIDEARPFTIKAKSLADVPLILYEWQKGLKVYNDQGCFFTYDLTDPTYGDRVVYVSNRPNGLDTDVLFKYTGVPSSVPPGSSSGSWSRGFSWSLCTSQK